VDGAARGNPGAAGFGVYLEDRDRRERAIGALGETTNNVAEYAALIAALTLARRLGIDHLVVHSDSQLLVRQMNGEYRVKAGHLKPMYQRAVELAAGFASFAIRHVRREDNGEADRLANLAIDERAPCPDWLVLDVIPEST
jgi:ribonuclease HI